MLGLSKVSNISRLAATKCCPVGVEVLPSLSGTQHIRCFKMRLDPPNMNKQFYVPEPPMQLLGELDETNRLEQKFLNADESLRMFLGALYHRESTVLPQYRTQESLEPAIKHLESLYEAQHGLGEAPASAEEVDEKEHQEMMIYNDQENARMAKLREDRMRHELDDRVEQIMLEKLEHQSQEEKATNEALRVLQDTEEFCKTFIAPEDLHKELERAFDNPIDYCFAIDKQGNMYPGNNTKPTDIDPEDRPRIDDPNQLKVGAIPLVKRMHKDKLAADAQ